jgi:hypothetical protein
MDAHSRSLILAILIATCVTFTPRTSFSAVPLPSDDEVTGIVKACGGGRFQEIQGDIEGKISIWKRDATASGKASKGDLGAILQKVPRDAQISPENYKIYTDCILKAMSKYLNAQVTPPPDGTRPNAAIISELRRKVEEAQAQAQDARANAVSARATAGYVRQYAISAKRSADVSGDGKNGYWRWGDALNGSYSGQYQNGAANGYGVVILANGDRYEGNFQNGVPNGHGFYFSRDGRYEGEFRNGVRDGYGVEFFADGSSYQGQYQYNAFMGVGVYTWRGGDRYEGEERNGINGYGLKILNGTRYEGRWQNGVPQDWIIRVANGKTWAEYWPNGRYMRSDII